MAEAAVPAAAAAGSLLSAKHTTICVLDFGSQYSHLVVRRIRELGVYCELHSCLVDASVLEAMPLLKGVIFSGGPFSVYEEGAPHVHASVWAFLKRTRVPVLGVCYGLQEMTHALGGAVERAEKREFGHALVARTGASLPEGMADILEGMPAEFKVWMSHGDKLVKLAPGFTIIGSSDNCEGAMVAGFVEGIPMYGVQFHPGEPWASNSSSNTTRAVQALVGRSIHPSRQPTHSHCLLYACRGNAHARGQDPAGQLLPAHRWRCAHMVHGGLPGRGGRVDPPAGGAGGTRDWGCLWRRGLDCGSRVAQPVSAVPRPPPCCFILRMGNHVVELQMQATCTSHQQCCVEIMPARPRFASL